MSSLLYGNKTFVVAIKYFGEVDIEVFCYSPMSLDFFVLFQIYCPGL